MKIQQPKLNDFAKEVYLSNLKKGFDVQQENLGQSLMLVNSELCEALEAYRKDTNADIPKFNTYNEEMKDWYQSHLLPEDIPIDQIFQDAFNEHIKDTFEDEIADTFIRLLDIVGGLEIDIDFHIEAKRRFNALREYKHGKKY